MDKRMLSFLRTIAILGAIITGISLFLFSRNFNQGNNYENITLGLAFGGMGWVATAGVFWQDEDERAKRKDIFRKDEKRFSLINNWLILFGILFTIVFHVIQISNSPEKKLMGIIACVMEVLVLLRILLLRI